MRVADLIRRWERGVHRCGQCCAVASFSPTLQVRVWPRARLCGTTVGEPGGVLHKLKLAQNDEEAESLDMAGSGGLMNGSLLVVSSDGVSKQMPWVEM